MLRYRVFWLASQSIFHFGYTPANSGILTREKLTLAPSQIWWFLDTEFPKIIRIHFRRSKPSKLGSSHCKKKHLWGIPQPMPPPKALASCSRCSITVSRWSARRTSRIGAHSPNKWYQEKAILYPKCVEIVTMLAPSYRWYIYIHLYIYMVFYALICGWLTICFLDAAPSRGC
jgi:hypothetical protein